MALTFARDTTNILNIGTGNGGAAGLIHGKAQVALAFWFTSNAAYNTAANNNNRPGISICSAGGIGIEVNIDAFTSPANGVIRTATRSVSTDTVTNLSGATNLGAGGDNVWRHILMNVDYAAKTLKLWLNGTLEINGSSLTNYTGGTFNKNTPSVPDRLFRTGQATAAANAFAGLGAEVALWGNWTPTAAEIAALAAKVSPQLVAHSKLLAHWPLYGNVYSGSITAATKANPCAVTSALHGLQTNDKIVITGVSGMTQLNNVEFTVTVTGANTFTLGVDSSAYGVYTSGGTWVRQMMQENVGGDTHTTWGYRTGTLATATHPPIQQPGDRLLIRRDFRRQSGR